MQRETADHLSPQETVRVVVYRSSGRPHADRKYDLPRGVSVTRYGKYQAIFRSKFLGSFETVEEARQVYECASGEKKMIESGSYCVDAKILELIKPFAWCLNSKGYWKGRVNGVEVMQHQLAWRLYGGQEPCGGECIDHIDRDPSNNASANLRLVTSRGNSLNTLGECVRFCPSKKFDGTGTWGVRIKVNGQAWSRNYSDESTARLVAKNKKQLEIEKEVIAYVPCP